MIDTQFRSMEKDGNRYLFGSVKFNSTTTRRLIEQNLPRLKRYPAVHYMRTARPIGQIDFNSEIHGKRTYLGDDAFHLLIKIYDECDEWPILRDGSWGFELEARGDVVFAVTVVDAPIETDNVAYAIQRSCAGLRQALLEERFTFDDDGHIVKRYFPISTNIAESYQELDFPEHCSMSCEHIQCGFRRPQNEGRSCFLRWKSTKENP